jgi:hypothetical protein
LIKKQANILQVLPEEIMKRPTKRVFSLLLVRLPDTHPTFAPDSTGDYHSMSTGDRTNAAIGEICTVTGNPGTFSAVTWSRHWREHDPTAGRRVALQWENCHVR